MVETYKPYENKFFSFDVKCGTMSYEFNSYEGDMVVFDALSAQNASQAKCVATATPFGSL